MSQDGSGSSAKWTPMEPETEKQLLERRLEQMGEGAAEAIRREVEWLREHNFPVWIWACGRQGVLP